MLATVLGALSTGFIQTLKLFAITLIGALPLGLIISFGSMSRWAPFARLGNRLRAGKIGGDHRPPRLILPLVDADDRHGDAAADGGDVRHAVGADGLRAADFGGLRHDGQRLGIAQRIPGQRL